MWFNKDSTSLIFNINDGEDINLTLENLAHVTGVPTSGGSNYFYTSSPTFFYDLDLPIIPFGKQGYSY